MTTAPATTATAAFALRTRLIHDECAAEELAPVESCDHFFGLRIVPNFGESKTARLARKPITKERERIRLHARFGE
jgi:hypothetical protein